MVCYLNSAWHSFNAPVDLLLGRGSDAALPCCETLTTLILNWHKISYSRLQRRTRGKNRRGEWEPGPADTFGQRDFWLYTDVRTNTKVKNNDTTQGYCGYFTRNSGRLFHDLRPLGAFWSFRYLDISIWLSAVSCGTGTSRPKRTSSTVLGCVSLSSWKGSVWQSSSNTFTCTLLWLWRTSP